ncbi:MAG TPA: hypothetical protein VK854_11650, partial [Woeseiaceae bacterium]|nr:hypothetical protein [Woeseiaceae bacterium]
GERFFDYTAYGDTINIAARLEQANRSLGTRICVSATVAERAKNFVGRPVGQLLLRGRSDPLGTFEPLSADAFNEPSTRAYLDSFALLETQDPGALPAFASLVGVRPQDALAHFHLKRLMNGASGIAIEV